MNGPVEAHGVARRSGKPRLPLRLSSGARASLFAVFITAIGLLDAGPALALGIGEPRTVSRLFEPLRIDIPIDAAADDDSLRARLSIARGDDEDGSSNNGLIQELVTDASGQRFLRVRSRTPVHEPVLMLHVDLSGKGVAVRRDLTLLFDPPTSDTDTVRVEQAGRDRDESFSQAQASSGSASKPSLRLGSGRDARIASTTNREPRPVDGVAPLRARSRHAARIADGAAPPSETRRSSTSTRSVDAANWQHYGPIQRGETLASVAERTRPSAEVPVATMSLLLRWLNPGSFDAQSGDLLPGTLLSFPDPKMLGGLAGPGVSAVAAAAGAPSLPPSSKGLQLAGALSPASMQLLAAGAGRTGSVQNGAAAVSVPVAAGPQPRLALSESSTQAANAVALQLNGPVVPYWLIGLALLVSAAMVWMLVRILRSSPAPVPMIPIQARSNVVHGPATAADLLPGQRIAPTIAGLDGLASANEKIADDEIAVQSAPEPEAEALPQLAEADWHPDQFDLLITDGEEEEPLAAESGKRLLRLHPDELSPAVPSLRTGTGRR